MYACRFLDIQGDNVLNRILDIQIDLKEIGKETLKIDTTLDVEST